MVNGGGQGNISVKSRTKFELDGYNEPHQLEPQHDTQEQCRIGIFNSEKVIKQWTDNVKNNSTTTQEDTEFWKIVQKEGRKVNMEMMKGRNCFFWSVLDQLFQDCRRANLQL